MIKNEELLDAEKTIRSFCGSGSHKYEMCDTCPFFVNEGPSGKCGLTSVAAPDDWDFKNIGERQKIVEESKEWQMTLIQFSITNIREFCRLHACAECPLVGWCGAISEPDVPPCYWPDLIDTLAANEDEK